MLAAGGRKIGADARGQLVAEPLEVTLNHGLHAELPLDGRETLGNLCQRCTEIAVHARRVMAQIQQIGHFGVGWVTLAGR